MNLSRLVLREIRHRLLNFSLAVLAVVLAASVLVAVISRLDRHDRQTQAILEEHQTIVEARTAELSDDMRKITKGLGFNVLILPEDQDLTDIYAEGFAAKTMPESYVDRLANARTMTIDHLLPTIEQRIEWPEQKRTIILVGVRGQVPIVWKEQKKPIMNPVAEGEIVLGYELARSLELSVGDSTTLRGREFKVANVYEQRGNKDDVTAWISLKTAQALTGNEGRINSIWALNCNCATVDMLGEVRKEIATILPDTQVHLLMDKATARADARNRATKEAKQALADAARQQAEVRRQIESLAGLLVPVLIVASGAWVGLLAFTNVRDRRNEIGILRAIGLRRGQILRVFLAKAAIVGLAGAAIGCAVGVAVAQFQLGPMVAWTLIATLIAAPLLAALASWIPAMLASQQDPASVLAKE